ncbi:DUF1932 domain-containing protein [Terrabacter sp. 2RAF25]|uniref:NAD(P)-dependent oxidoreductase n=1 Tax=Terrabacter sp. 2RAF25 TaxID=3232998 RepID=UPI003F9B2465
MTGDATATRTSGSTGATSGGGTATVGIVSPGAMGSALGRAWARAGNRVVATVTGRSERTRGLAHGLELLADLDEVVSSSDVVVSICPPSAADDVLADIIASARRAGSSPVVLEANALAPDLVEALASTSSAAGLTLVDGSVSGGPPSPDGDTMLYLSGAGADRIASLPAEGLRRRVVGPEVGQASAVKMCTASVYKGTTAIWAQALQSAAALGVLDVVLDDLSEEFPRQVEGAGRRIAVATAKSARFVAEMEHIARTQGRAGTSVELFEGMAAVYRRLAGTSLAALSPEEAAAVVDLREVLARLT